MIREQHLTVKKTARYCTLGEPGAHVNDVWIACHGFGHLAREFIAEFESIASADRIVVAPEALSRFYKSQGTVHGPDTPVGATWMTREDRESEIQDYVGYMETLSAELIRRVSPDAKITALGFSQGAATVSRWVAARAKPVHRVILWGGLLPPEFNTRESLAGLAPVPIVFACGTSDRYFPRDLIAREFERMKDLGLDVTLVQFEGGHVLDQPTLRKIATETA